MAERESGVLLIDGPTVVYRDEQTPVVPGVSFVLHPDKIVYLEDVFGPAEREEDEFSGDLHSSYSDLQLVRAKKED